MNQWDLWLTSEQVDEKTKQTIREMSEEERTARFERLLEFGTAGLRGRMGPGLDRMNVYTVRHVTQALAETLFAHKDLSRGIVIAYDCRHQSRTFAWESAATLAANGIPSFLFDDLRPTPELSFAVRQLGADGGINITASHNPKEYNGYKVYGADGAQISPEQARTVSEKMEQLDILRQVKTCTSAERDKKITILGEQMDQQYLNRVLAQSAAGDMVREMADTFSLIYTPFHGAGRSLVPQVLRRLGLRKVFTVAEQMIPDGSFPTVKSPNPEEKEGFTLAVKLARQKGAGLIIGTDPDADRVGVMVERNGEYLPLSGNQVGVLLTDYLIKRRREQGTLQANAAVIKSVVSTPMADAVCASAGLHLANVLTGFKFIGEKMEEWKKTGEHTYLFGFEESCGYLAGTHARDKDGVEASMLIAEMACWYKKQGMSLLDGLERLYEAFGWYEERVLSLAVADAGGVTSLLRKDLPKTLGGYAVIKIRDYLTGLDGLPPADLLFFDMAEATLAVRPSGTEPKVKVYVMARGKSWKKAKRYAAGCLMLRRGFAVYAETARSWRAFTDSIASGALRRWGYGGSGASVCRQIEGKRTKRMADSAAHPVRRRQFPVFAAFAVCSRSDLSRSRNTWRNTRRLSGTGAYRGLRLGEPGPHSCGKTGAFAGG